MSPEWLWVGVAVAGYVLAMVCNPLRGFFAEAYDLLRGGGLLRLWLPVAILSLVLAGFDWWAPEHLPGHLGVAVAADGASLFTGAAGFRIADGAGDLPVKTRAALSIGALFWAALVIGLQFFVLVALYLRVLMPERDPGLRGLFDFAWRRVARFWPGLLLVAAFGACGVWLAPGGWGAVVSWSLAGVAAAVFAFVQVSLLSGERTLGEAVVSNFGNWRSLAYGAGWFLIVAALQLFLLNAANFSAVAWAIGKGGGWRIAWDVFYSAVRAGVMLWLMAAWVLFFCAKTKNPTKRKIRP